MLPIGLEPILLSELDFESSVSACFTKGAYEAQISTPHRKEECYYVGEDAVLGNRTPKCATHCSVEVLLMDWAYWI